MESKAGVLYITVKKANLTHDTELMGKMDPFVVLKVGKFQQQTSIKENAGKIAEWNEKFEFTARHGDTLEIHVLDKEDVGADDEIGHAELYVNAELLKQRQTHTIPIYYGKDNKNKGGEVALEIEFSEVENKELILSLVENKKQQIEALENIIRGLRVEIDGLRKKNKDLTEEREKEKARWQEEKVLLVKSAESQKEGIQNHEVELIAQITHFKEEINQLQVERNHLLKAHEENKKKIEEVSKDNTVYRQKLRSLQKEEESKSPFDFTCCGGAMATVLIFTTYVIGSRF
jgi:Ca2+-dependent lipid-binding protein